MLNVGLQFQIKTGIWGILQYENWGFGEFKLKDLICNEYGSYTSSMKATDF